MPSSPALMSLLPLVGAAALTVQGVRRMRARRGTEPAVREAPPQPIEIEDPNRRVVRQKKAVADGTCTECGTSVPGRSTVCTACERRIAGASNSAFTTGLHWLVFLAAMTAIIGAGALYAP